MKILVIGPHASPIIQRLVLNLKERGHSVWLASHNAENQEAIINLGQLNSIIDFFMMGKICKIVEEIQPDVVHAHVVNHYGIMAWKQSKPLVVALWGSEVMLAPYTGGYIKGALFRLLNCLVLRRAERCHTSAQHVAMEADKQCRGVNLKTRVFYWGLPLSKPSENEAKGHRRKVAHG